MIKIFFLSLLLLVSCGGNYNPSNPNNVDHTTADWVDFTKYDGKTVKAIRYYEDARTIPGCDDLIIWFTDGTRVRFHASKYLLKVSD
jgi:hypothetical protein